ncbi:M48 family metallopeptidase [Xanthomonas campestris]|uniref:M48 family metallopeptidase n=1 Tax=Xanthomonas campestris TaxID=339 RepID=UPI001E553951|nr:SprT family zinc-dependent metalloprotease [Xanthomonas campestris]MCC5066377.1 M48 family metallopeptidase [Xanthomonas campestris]
MKQTHIRLGELDIAVTFKAVKNVHLSVHPPEGEVTLVAPTGTRLEVARAYAISKLRWIRQQQVQLLAQVRETPRQFVTRESHYIWGRRYLLAVVERDTPPAVKMDHRRITLSVRPGTDAGRREAIYQRWQRSLLHEAIQPLIAHWEGRIGVKVEGYFLQRMKTKWGSCNHLRAHIRLNTELVKKPRDLLEYVIVHEMIHLLEPTHNARFIALLDKHYAGWRDARAELNALPLAT